MFDIFTPPMNPKASVIEVERNQVPRAKQKPLRKMKKTQLTNHNQRPKKK